MACAGVVVALAPLAARAQEPAAPTDDSLKWSGLVLPIAGANSVDGFGFGVGGEVFARPESQEYGYAVKVTGSAWVTTRWDYTSNFVRLEVVGDRTSWYGQIGYRGWRNLRYAGVGGADVLVDWGAQEVGNSVTGPAAFAGVLRPLTGPWALYTQLYFRGVRVEPGAGAKLEEDLPLGAAGGAYGDWTVGLWHDSTDHWPLPNRGLRGEVDVRGGGTLSAGSVEPLLGLHSELAGWTELGTPHLVVGGRLLAARTFGERPFFEQDVTGGRWRDELGSEQALSGYGRTRTRGDGVVASMVELRPFFFRTSHPFWDLGVHASVFAELAWLFDGAEPGPPLPTVGFGPELLWQSAIQLRPFLAWGWRAESPGGERSPGLQFGISFLDPL